MGLAAILFVVLLGLLTNEAQAYQPLLQKILIKIALALLTPARRERYREEWPLVLQDTTGEVTRTVRALCFINSGLLFRIGDSLNYLKPRLLRCVPILDPQKYGVMWMEDLIVMLKSPDVTLLDYKDVQLSEKTFRTEIKLQYNDNLSKKEFAKKLGLSRASDPWQTSRPVWFLRRGYGLLIKPRRGRKLKKT